MGELAAIALTVFAAAQEKTADRNSGNKSVQEKIKKLEDERNQAILHGDFATLDRMTSEDYTFVTLRGEMRTKAEILKGFKSGSFKYDSREVSDTKVRVYGDTAIVTGRAIQKGLENGKDYSGDYRFTRVYVNQTRSLGDCCLTSNPYRQVGTSSTRQPTEASALCGFGVVPRQIITSFLGGHGSFVIRPCDGADCVASACSGFV